MNPKRTVLVVTYGFPPAGGAGIKRLLKFLRFLPENGWQPVILTVQKANLDVADPSLLKELDPKLDVYRTPTLENLFVGGVSTRVRKAGVARGQSGTSSGRSIRTLLLRLYKWAGGFFKIPDSEILWVPSAFVVGLWIAITRRPHAIFASGPSFTDLVLAAMLRRMTGIRLVVDFRDAWISDPMHQIARRYLRKAHARLEAFVIHTANAVISTNPYVTSDFKARYPKEPQDKWATIFNGFDAADYSHMRSYHRHLYEGKFAIVFTGRLYGERSPFYFLLALRSAFKEEPDMRSNTSVVFVGLCERFLDGRTVEEYAEQLHLRDVVELKGHISRMRSLEYQVEASVLLLLIGIVNQRKAYTYGISGKVFDYLASERPILALAEVGASRAFLVENQLATVFSHGDKEGIKQYLLSAYRAWRRGETLPYCPKVKYGQFDFLILTASLAAYLSGSRCRSAS